MNADLCTSCKTPAAKGQECDPFRDPLGVFLAKMRGLGEL